MTAAAKEKREVTLPEGVSLRRVAEVLLDAWEADPRRWMNAPPQLREGPSSPSAMPVPQDALDLFRLLAERRALKIVCQFAVLSWSTEWTTLSNQ